jgi:hypothetical protein
MSNVIKVWYLSNNETGEKLFSQIKKLGIQADYFDISEISNIVPLQEDVNVFVFDLVDLQTDFILDIVVQDERFKNSLKLCLLSKKQISEFHSKSYSSCKLELLQRPADNEMFLVLLEKSLLVELYRSELHSVSFSNSKVYSFEGIMEINRKQPFKANAESLSFDSIIEFQSHFQEEQAKLKKEIKKMHFDLGSFLAVKD